MIIIEQGYGHKLMLPFDDAVAYLAILHKAKRLKYDGYQSGQGYMEMRVENCTDLPSLGVVPDNLVELLAEAELLEVTNIQQYLKERGVILNL